MLKHDITMWLGEDELPIEVEYTYSPAEYEDGHLFMPESIEIQTIKVYPPAWMEKRIIADIEMAREIEQRELRVM
jgi:glycyl-tRNA synthetase beta subunit